MSIEIFVSFEIERFNMEVYPEWTLEKLYKKCSEGYEIDINWLELSCDDIPLTEMNTTIEQSNLYNGCEVKMYKNKLYRDLNLVFEYMGAKFNEKKSYTKEEISEMGYNLFKNKDGCKEGWPYYHLLWSTGLMDINYIDQDRNIN